MSTAPVQPIGRDRQMNIDRLSASALIIAARTTHMEDQHFTAPLSYRVWDTRYRWREDGKVRDQSIEDTWRRVARALASVESEQGVLWEKRFYGILGGFRFVPGGRILAGAGTDRRVTLFNCFVMGTIEDSVSASFEALQEGALTMQQGGGIGCDFSSLRPSGNVADAKGGVASGPVSSMRVWDSMCATLLTTNARRGAMMATLCCDHPDIEQFIDAKADGTELRHFNLSVLVSEAFMQALAADADWPLVFPCVVGKRTTAQLGSGLPREANAHDCRVYRRVRARDLWNKLMRANYDYAEPGVIFIDRVQSLNNLRYCEEIRAANPCGEIPLPDYGACDLGSLNLTRFVQSPFTQQAEVDWDALRKTTAIAVRMLDDVYEISAFPLQRQRDVALRSRRIGLGITGLADALIMLGMTYGDPASLRIAADIMQEICHSAYRASIELAKERPVFPAFEAEPYLRSEFVSALPKDIRAAIAKHGIRNSHLTAIAPTGSISLLANNVSSGLEPVFAAEYGRLVRDREQEPQLEQAVDYAVHLYRTTTGETGHLPPAFVTSGEVEPEVQLAMQAALQKHVDNAISKTVSVPAQFEFERFSKLFETAYGLGLKGCTTFRPNAVTGSILVRENGVDSCCKMPAAENIARNELIA